MTDDAARERAARLRDRIARRAENSDKHQADEPAADEPTADEPDEGPRPGESPHHYVERRMRETLKKKE